jgi:outer membrane protein OmpA-like peptidoglycan-associated protein
MKPEDLASLRRSVYFEFAAPNRLVRMFQKKDVLGAKADKVPKAVSRVVELQKNRGDFAILGERKPSHFLPSAVHFDVGSDKIDHKTHSVIIRVASYMLANSRVTVELSGLIDSDTPIGQAKSTIERRAEVVKSILTEAGVEASRISINTDVTLTADVEKSDFEKAAKRLIRFTYKGSDQIKLVKQEFDVKVRQPVPATATPPNTTPRTPQSPR